MKVAIKGGAGREFGLGLNAYLRGHEVFFYGVEKNNATCVLGTNIPITDYHAIGEDAQKRGIGIMLTGSEDDLFKRIVNKISKYVPIFGPTAEAAILEGSKIFSAKLCKEYGIPAPESLAARTLDNAAEAISILYGKGETVWLKADVPCGGKGAWYGGATPEEAMKVAEMLMGNEDKGIAPKYGDKSRNILVQVHTPGQEATFTSISDGKDLVHMITTMDYPHIQAPGVGVISGGMGTILPNPYLNRVAHKETVELVEKEIMEAAVSAMRSKNMKYVGPLYGGLILSEDGPVACEYNARWGAPEAEDIISALEYSVDENGNPIDIAEYGLACVEGRLDEMPRIIWTDKKIVGVVVSHKNYSTGKRVSGHPIYGIGKDFNFNPLESHWIMPAGMTWDNEIKKWRQGGGRAFMSMGSSNKTYNEAKQIAMNPLITSKIRFGKPGDPYFRHDVGDVFDKDGNLL